MDDIDLITQALHDGKTSEEIDKIFSDADAAFVPKVQAMLGSDGLAQYQAYSQNLGTSLTALQFKDSLTGSDDAKAAKITQLSQLMQQQTQTALSAAGLPSDYQVVPILNFRNIASETTEAQSLALLDSIYAGVASQASSFLSPDEMQKFQEFRSNAIANSRTVLTMNRQLMAPITK
jgi:hypothetical protein